jgi:hypothetical protein
MRALVICGGAAGGAAIVAAGCKLEFLSWTVDWAGRLVGHFLSLDFHEGNSPAGLLLSLGLAWVVWSVIVAGVIRVFLKPPRRLGKPQ